MKIFSARILTATLAITALCVPSFSFAGGDWAMEEGYGYNDDLRSKLGYNDAEGLDNVAPAAGGNPSGSGYLGWYDDPKDRVFTDVPKRKNINVPRTDIQDPQMGAVRYSDGGAAISNGDGPWSSSSDGDAVSSLFGGEQSKDSGYLGWYDDPYDRVFTRVPNDRNGDVPRVDFPDDRSKLAGGRDGNGAGDARRGGDGSGDGGRGGNGFGGDSYANTRSGMSEYDRLKHKKLSAEALAVLHSITADKLPKRRRLLQPQFPAKIEHENIKNPFKDDGKIIENPEGVEAVKTGDVGLQVMVKDAETSPIEYLQTAHDALKAGQIQSAISYYEQVLELQPDNTDALFGLATAYHQAGENEEARMRYIELIGQNNNHRGALNNFILLASEEAPADALRELAHLQKIQPEFAPIPAMMGMIYADKGDMELAVRHLGRAAVLDPDNIEYRYNLAVLFDHMGQVKLASKLYYQVLTEGMKGRKLPATQDEIRRRLDFLASGKSLAHQKTSRR